MNNEIATLNSVQRMTVNSPSIEPNVSEAARFISLLGDGKDFTFQTFDDSERKDLSLARVFHGTLEQHADDLIALNKQGAGVFIMVNRGDGITRDGSKTCRTKSNVTSVRSIFIDIDDAAKEKIASVMSSSVKPSIVVESSSGKFHCYWLIADCSLDSFTEIQTAFAAKYQSDPAVKDLPRVMRLAGFFHQKKEPVVTVLRDDLSSFSVGLELSNIMASNGISQSSLFRQNQSPLAIVSKAIPEGTRNETLTKVAGQMRSRGLNENELIAKLLELNQERCIPPLPTCEVLSIANSINRYTPSINAHDLTESLTDTGNAERFAKRYCDTVKYVPDWGRFIVFNGHYWQVDLTNKIMEFAKHVARDIYLDGNAVDDLKLRHDLAKHSMKSQQLQRLNAMIELAKSIESMIITSGRLNADDMLLCIKNGVVDLRDGTFRGGRREDFITQIAPVTFDPDARCPRFLQFLDETFVGESASTMQGHVSSAERKELIDYVQKLLSYCLTGKTGEQCLFFAYGTGANGKTTLVNLLLALLGSDYALQTPMDTLMVKSGGTSSSNHLARLQNVRFVASTEVEDGARMSESLIKQMTGGDRIAARFLYKEFVEFTPKFKLFIAGNHKPVIKGDDLGIWRRIHLVPFEITVSSDKRDSTLPEQLRAELSGIFNWLIDGCIKWQKSNLHKPSIVEKAIQEYKDEMDTLGQWVSDCCEIGEAKKTGSGAAYESYRCWASDNGFQAICSTNFYRKLSDRFEKKRSSAGNYYHGVSCC